MLTRRLPVALLLAAWAGRAGAEETSSSEAVQGEPKKATPEAQGPSFDLAVEASVAGGVRDGRGVRTLSAATVLLRARALPGVEIGAWRLELPLRAAHEQVAGESLDETRGEAGLELRWRRGPRLRVTAGAGIEAVWRPRWADLYQPAGDGTYLPTDRHGYWERRVELGVAGIPIRHHHARARWRYSLDDYADDPRFDPVAAPTHLAPFDKDRHQIDLSWRYLGDGWKLGAELDLRRDSWFFLFARDAGTGLTHAPPGGAPPNPLQVELAAEPGVAAEVAVGRLEISAGYGVELVDDTYQGYYSYLGHHPQIGLRASAGRLSARLLAQASLRRYGENSYRAGAGHPPLVWGDRRVDRRWSASLDAAWDLGAGLALTLECDAILRRTNFPPYVPEVNPAGRDYDIDWSYDNFMALVGVAFRR